MNFSESWSAVVAQAPKLELEVYCDGASSGNPGPGGWGIVGLRAGCMEQRGGHAPQATNNAMELRAALEALKWIREKIDLHGATAEDVRWRVLTDSSYVIQGITRWASGWQRRGWTTSEGSPVLNRDSWEALISAESLLPQGEWVHVPGHAGVRWNERADAIATRFSRDPHHALDPGPLPISEDSRTWPVYLSYLDGRLERHPNWADCEARVRGRSGARFKKVASEIEESETLASWKLTK